MPLADFTVHTTYEDVPREVRVVVYDSVSALRAAATRYDNAQRLRSKRLRDSNADTLGVCHRFELQDHKGNSKPPCAIVRYARPHTGAGIVSHELAHAAVWMRELHEGDKALTCEDDEPFAWTLGDLVRQTVDAMYDRNVYE